VRPERKTAHYLNEMSRVMWGVVTKASLRADEEGKGKHQTTLLQFAPTAATAVAAHNGNNPIKHGGTSITGDANTTALHKRPREGEEHNDTPQLPPARSSSKTGDVQEQWLQLQHRHVRPDDGIMYGPSGGGNRETQNRRPMVGAPPPPVVVMPNLASTSAAPYSRANIAAVREARHIDGAARGRAATTEFDDALLDVFLPDGAPDACPRDVLRGCCFFLNSCDADPMITTYLLEKLIRRLGGVTSMSAGGVASYVVTQHLSSAKEIKVVSGGRRGGAPPPKQRHIHPHWILACAKEGKRVAEAPFLTVRLALGASSSNIANSTTSGSVKPTTSTTTTSAAADTRRHPLTSSSRKVVTGDAATLGNSNHGDVIRLQQQRRRISAQNTKAKDNGDVIVID
jgi:hypothetical protein